MVDSLVDETEFSNTTLESGVISGTAEASTKEVSEYPPTPTLRECLSFALPALGIYTCPPLMSLIDASFIGRTSSLELAALGPASAISDSAPLPLLFISIAATNLIAKSYAQNDSKASAIVSRTALGMGAVGGMVLATALYAYAYPLSFLYCGGQSAAATAQALAPACAKYVAVRALALPAVLITTIAQAICIGTKDTKTPMISVALAGALNFAGDLVLVKWLGKGIAGAAWATAMSQVLAGGLLLRVLKKRGFLERSDTTTAANDENTSPNQVDTAKQILSFIPFLFVMTVKIGWHNACAATAASLGGAQAAAHTALLSVGMLCFTFGDVGSSLAQAFVPAFVKNGDSKNEPSFDLDAAVPTIKQLLKCTLSISTTVVCLASILIGLFGGQITSDPAVLTQMRKTLPWIMAALSLHGSAVTLEGILLARKKLRGLTIWYTFLAATIAAFQVATRQFGLGLAGVWGCYIWVSGSRVIAFSALGGLLRPRKWFPKFKSQPKLKSA